MILYWRTGGFDGPIHISEEVSNARTAVPWAIVSSIGIAGILGFGASLSFLRRNFAEASGIWIVINIVLAFYMGNDIEAILASPIGQPMAAVGFVFSQLILRVQFTVTLADILQQLWHESHARTLVHRCPCAVSNLY